MQILWTAIACCHFVFPNLPCLSNNYVSRGLSAGVGYLYVRDLPLRVVFRFSPPRPAGNIDEVILSSMCQAFKSHSSWQYIATQQPHLRLPNLLAP